MPLGKRVPYAYSKNIAYVHLFFERKKNCFFGIKSFLNVHCATIPTKSTAISSANEWQCCFCNEIQSKTIVISLIATSAHP